MKTLKTILVSLGILIGIPLIVAIFIKKDYKVEKVVIINKPNLEVFNYLKLLKNQDNFSKWATMDLNMIKYFKGTDGEVGFIAGWDSTNEEVGTGEQEITQILEGKRIDYALHFFKPFEANDVAYIETEAIDSDKTKVVWGFKGNMKYPSNIFILLMNIEEQIANDIQFSLDNLKQLLEN